MLAILFVFLLLNNAPSQAQIEVSRQAEVEFSAGLSLYRKGEFKAAAAVFEKVVRNFAPNQRTTAAYVMKAKAELYGGDPDVAEKTLIAFLSAHKKSSYIADAEFTLGLVNAKKQQHERALVSFLNALRLSVTNTKTPDLREEVVKALDETVEGSIAAATLVRLANERRTEVEEEYLRAKLGIKQATVGDYSSAEATLETLKKKFSKPEFSEKTAALEALLNKPRKVKLGILLPLMKKGDQSAIREKEIGTALLDGVSFALEEYLKSSRTAAKVVLEIRDTERDLSIARAGMKELAEDQSVICIIGPAFSTTALAVSGVANEKSVSLITPTANANGIAATGPYVFQANPDLETRAKAMAQYAVKHLKLLRLAVLSPQEQGSKTLADHFSKEAMKLGARVMTTELYERGARDLTRQFSSIRRKAEVIAREPYISFNSRIGGKEASKLMKLGVSADTLDALMATRGLINAVDLLGDNAKSKLEANGIPYTIGDPRLDSTQRIAKAIQGIYCPISSSVEIGMISSQCVFFGIGAMLLGSGEWNNTSELKTNQRYCEGVLFEADSWGDHKRAEYSDFVDRFSQRFNKVPNKNNLLGYDIAQFVLSLIQTGATTREQMKTALSQADTYEAIHANMWFSRRRVNSWLHILKYTSETIQHVSQINVE